MKAFLAESLVQAWVVRSVISPAEAPKECWVCNEPAVQEIRAWGVGYTFFFCLRHAFAHDA